MNTQIPTYGEDIATVETVVCGDLEQLITAVTNSNDPTNARFSFGRGNQPQGIVPGEISASSLQATLVGLPSGMTVHPCFSMYFDPDVGTCWMQISLASKYQVTGSRTWLNGADIFFSKNLASWYDRLQIDSDDTSLHFHRATIRHTVFRVCGNFPGVDEIDFSEIPIIGY